MTPQSDRAEPLEGLDRVLDRLLTVMQGREPDTLDGAAREHVEVAIEAAIAAAGRARETPFAREAEAQIHEASAVAAALLEELRATHRESGAIVERSLALRRKAIHLTASALALSRQAERARAVATSAGEARRGNASAGALHGIRILLVGGRVGPEASFGMLLSAVGAQVHEAASVADAVRVARTLHPEVLVCDMPLPAAEGLICDLRRRGVIAPALAVGPAADAATRAAGRAAGFANVLARPVTPATLVRAVRAALGA